MQTFSPFIKGVSVLEVNTDKLEEPCIDAVWSVCPKIIWLPENWAWLLYLNWTFLVEVENLIEPDSEFCSK